MFTRQAHRCDPIVPVLATPPVCLGALRFGTFYLIHPFITDYGVFED
jgi:hypothetical protein